MRLAASDQADAIKDARQLLFALARFPEVRALDPRVCSTFFVNLMDQYPQYANLGIVASDGRLVCSVSGLDQQLQFADREFLHHVLETRDFGNGLDEGLTADRTMLHFGYPILDDEGQAQSIVFSSMDILRLSQLAAEAQLPQGTTLSIIEDTGRILARHPDPDLWVGQSVVESALFTAILSQEGEGTADTTGIDDIPRLFAFTTLLGLFPGVNAYIVIGIPSSGAFAGANEILARNLAGLGIVTILAIAAGWLGGNIFVLRWVDVLVRAAQQINAGDLTVQTGLPYGKGELGQLAHAFDEMTVSLNHRIAERDRAEAALYESQRSLLTLMSHLPGMAYRCHNDSDRSMIFASEGALDLTGFHPAALAQNRTVSYADLIHPDDREAVMERIQVAVEKDQPFRLTYRIRTHSGELKWVSEQGQKVVSAEDGISPLEGLIVDVTERVLAYQMLEQRVADRTRELSALYDVTAVASESLELQTVLDRSLDQVLSVMTSDVGAIHLLEETDRLLHLAASRGVTSNGDDHINAIAVGEGLAGLVIERGEPFTVPDVSVAPRPLLAIPTRHGQAYVGVPIRAKGRILGVLSVIGVMGRQFDEDEVTLLDSIADHVGVAVDNARLYQQAEQLAVMNERHRLARELHDAVSQSLYSLSLWAEAGRRMVGNGNLSRAEDYLTRVGDTAKQALKEMRLLVYELRPPTLQKEGLAKALQNRLDAVEGRYGITARLVIDEPLELPALFEDELYRIAQEALNNIMKHAAANLVTLSIRQEGRRIHLKVVDNGSGFDARTVLDQGGMGLSNIRERAERLGGAATISSTPDEGTVVQVIVTLPEKSE